MTYKTKLMMTILDVTMNFGGIYNIFKLIAGATIGVSIYGAFSRHIGKLLVDHYYSFLGPRADEEELISYQQFRFRYRISLMGMNNFNGMVRHMIINSAVALKQNEQVLRKVDESLTAL
mmetsp:Transcript_8498/g.13045  ORF Transcript_8498/g.13045 Transcript_8498/m.13045 type:complete len:119 (+) Transcript_8498:1553-1909(+)